MHVYSELDHKQLRRVRPHLFGTRPMANIQQHSFHNDIPKIWHFLFRFARCRTPWIRSLLAQKDQHVKVRLVSKGAARLYSLGFAGPAQYYGTDAFWNHPRQITKWRSRTPGRCRIRLNVPKIQSTIIGDNRRHHHNMALIMLNFCLTIY